MGDTNIKKAAPKADDPFLRGDRFTSPEKRAASMAGLRPWGKDNPPPRSPGRPKRDNQLIATIERELAKKVPGDAHGRNFRTLLVQSLVRLACKGGSNSVDAARLIFDRVLGRCPTAEEINGQLPTTIIVQIARNTPRDFSAERAIDDDDTTTLQ